MPIYETREKFLNEVKIKKEGKAETKASLFLDYLKAEAEKRKKPSLKKRLKIFIRRLFTK